MTYKVLLERRVEKELRSLPRQALRRIDLRLLQLAEDPTPRGAVKLRGRETEGWRLRIGDYRILYTVDDQRSLVRVYRIKHRREAYL
ncbi:MAG: type II toxin-antitoxin system RelE/ParE family toxin [Chloroflexi bacterium]|nr:type II toxin-antitoxin system RelE/ParE family toxin [Chloroflexota bacterium]